MNKDQAKAIWDNYLQGKATVEERKLIESWYNHLHAQESELTKIDWNRVEANLNERLSFVAADKKKKIGWRRILIGVAGLFLFVTGITIYLNSPTIEPIPKEMVDQVIVSGGNKATLKLANGQLIPLSENKDAVFTRDGQNYYADGSLIATGDERVDRTTAVQNLEISIPNGGQYEVVLSDGTKVWLNSASSLKYPSSFANTTERTVELIGEGYFEVASNPKKPFYVKSKGQTVRVLGTHFNINAYADEPVVKTTLLEGKVAVNLPSGQKKDLAPGQQSIVQYRTADIRVQTVDPIEVVDWKNGDFVFDNASIETIMRKIARWYDVDVVFKGKMSTAIFNGVISRSKKITEVLQLLEATDAVHFNYEKTENIGRGRRIVVMP